METEVPTVMTVNFLFDLMFYILFPCYLVLKGYLYLTLHAYNHDSLDGVTVATSFLYDQYMLPMFFEKIILSFRVTSLFY